MEVCDNDEFPIATNVDNEAALASPLNGCTGVGNSVDGKVLFTMQNNNYYV